MLENTSNSFYCPQSHPDPLSADYSPIFMQFLDCVWQIMQHYPYTFQFNKYLLTFIAQNLHSCLYGNFLYDNERQRRDHEVGMGDRVRDGVGWWPG